jgi:hypothetical protein
VYSCDDSSIEYRENQPKDSNFSKGFIIILLKKDKNDTREAVFVFLS